MHYVDRVSTADARQQILAAVEVVISRHGVRGMTLRLVADEAGVSLGLLGYHFKNRDALILAAFVGVRIQIREAFEIALSTADQPDDRLRAFIRAAFTAQFLDGPYAHMRLSAWAMAPTAPVINEWWTTRVGVHLEKLGEFIAAARPDLGSQEAHNRAVDVLALSNGLWLGWGRVRNTDDLERGRQRCEAMALG